MTPFVHDFHYTHFRHFHLNESYGVWYKTLVTEDNFDLRHYTRDFYVDPEGEGTCLNYVETFLEFTSKRQTD